MNYKSTLLHFLNWFFWVTLLWKVLIMQGSLGCSKYDAQSVNYFQGATESISLSAKYSIKVKWMIPLLVARPALLTFRHILLFNCLPQLEKSQTYMFPVFPHLFGFFFSFTWKFHSTAQHLWLPLMDCFVPASNQSPILTDTQHLFCAWGVWKETNGKLPITLVWSLQEAACSQLLASTIVEIPAPNTAVSNEAVQFYSSELDGCHHISSEMNIFLVLLERRKFNQLKTSRGYIIECLPVRPPLIKTLFKIQSLQKFVDTNLTQWVHCYLNSSTALRWRKAVWSLAGGWSASSKSPQFEEQDRCCIPVFVIVTHKWVLDFIGHLNLITWRQDIAVVFLVNSEFHRYRLKISVSEAKFNVSSGEFPLSWQVYNYRYLVLQLKCAPRFAVVAWLHTWKHLKWIKSSLSNH